jgi:catechol 2,3-dioxygenase-like lactoylglutathione lyase family enzyme
MQLGPYDPSEHGTRVIPRLPSRDLRRTASFFAGLGFKTVLIEEGGGYLIIRKDWAEIHFRPDPAMDPLKTAESCYLRVADVDAVVAQILGPLPREGFPRIDPPATREWGMREAYLFDPDNNLFTIGAPHDAQFKKQASPSASQMEKL